MAKTNDAPDTAKTAPSKTAVRALAKGYFGGAIREPGDVFEIAADADLGGWMQPVNPDDAERLKPILAKMKRPAPTNPNIPQTPAMRKR
jgi:hypothetical protein